MRCLAETLAATDEASPRPLAMAEERRKREWGEADGEGLRGAVPPAPLFIKGRRRGSAAPSRPIQLLEVTASGAVDDPPRSIEGAWESTRTCTTTHVPCLRYACSERGARGGRSGTRGTTVPSKGSKWEAALRSRGDTQAASLLSATR